MIKIAQKLLILLLMPLAVFGRPGLDSADVVAIETSLREGTVAYQNEDFSEALQLFRAAFNACPPPYNTPLKLNAAKNYLGILGISKEYTSFERVATRVVQDLKRTPCDDVTNRFKVGILVNINGGAMYNEDSVLTIETYQQLVALVERCGLDSIDLAQGALNVANFYLNQGNAKAAYPLIELAQKYRGKHYGIYDAELSFCEARLLFYEHHFFTCRDRLLQCSDEFIAAKAYHRALNPVNWGIRRLAPFLDSVSIAELVERNFAISDSLGVSDNSAELKLVESLVKVNALQDELLLADKRKSTLISIVSLLSVMLAFGMSLLLFRKQSLAIKTLGSSIARYRKSSLNKDDVDALIAHCAKFGQQLEEGVHGKTNDLDADLIERLFAQFFPHVYKSILVAEPNWTVGERQLFITLLLAVKPTVGATFLKTSLNSYRVRKSKLIKKIPEEFKSDPRLLIASMPHVDESEE